MNDFELSCLVEDALVARNPRQMQTLQAALEPGYCLRAASLLRVWACSDFASDACVQNPEILHGLLERGDLLADSVMQAMLDFVPIAPGIVRPSWAVV